MLRREQAQCIKEDRFDDLFINQGWDRAHDRPFHLKLKDDEIFQVHAKYQKRGFAICFSEDEKLLALSITDKKRLLHKLSKVYYEHLLIIHATNVNGKRAQRWMVSIRPQDRPVKVVTVDWDESQESQKLIEKLQGLIFPIAEEEDLRLVDVVERVRFAFSANAQKLSRQFYQQFQKELQKFEGFIQGVTSLFNRKEYAALMLNRLMFIYFMQKKGFLDGNQNYLQDRLQQTQEKFGKDEFHNTFYRKFLRCLFHDGLDNPIEQRTNEINELLGKIPYLNGGLFDYHQLERDNSKIQIPDKAFKEIFDFFNDYNWHLDDRPHASGKDINPDVLGYIFEKYINERAQMGAYYTQEDITDYIAKNTILPFLLRKTRENCKHAFEPSGIWRLLLENPDNYIYDAIKHGCHILDNEIPENIRQGIDVNQPQLLDRRRDWNTVAPEEFALATETWREVIARRARYQALKKKMEQGEIQDVDGLITYNLDIVRFVNDAIQEYKGADFIGAFFRAIAGVRQDWIKGTPEKVRRGISVLDPACGSGAFLFAALKILHPLYEGCVERMEGFVSQDNEQAKSNKGKKHPLFRKVLDEINTHQNRAYWIYKTIILENLYGVDLMAEATEIAKLRLFLKLAAEAKYDPQKPNLGLEPLPDIDYNIRAGNSLVGFASMKQFEDLIASEEGLFKDVGLFSNELLKEVSEQAKIIQLANERFRQAQDRGGDDYTKEKDTLKKELKKLNEILDEYLAMSHYGHTKKELEVYKDWKRSHQPFHWFADFYGIIEDNGGFDVVVGNPPYVEYRKVIKTYSIRKYFTESCGNIYAFILERYLSIKNKQSFCSMIVPLSGHSTSRMEPLIDIFYRAPNQKIKLFNISADAHPSKLFSDVKFRLAIFISMPGNREIETTRYKRWYAQERNNLFSSIQYTKLQNTFYNFPTIAKIESSIHARIIEKISMCKERELSYDIGEYCLYYHNAPVNWIRVHTQIPYFRNERDGNEISTHLKRLSFSSMEKRDAAFLVLASSTFFIWWQVFSDCYDFNKQQIDDFPFNFSNDLTSKAKDMVKNIEVDMQKKSQRRTYHYAKTNCVVKYDEFYMKKSKALIDQIDVILAKHYGFTEEELDYIINYDIKYRMGKQ